MIVKLMLWDVLVTCVRTDSGITLIVSSAIVIQLVRHRPSVTGRRRAEGERVTLEVLHVVNVSPVHTTWRLAILKDVLSVSALVLPLHVPHLISSELRYAC